MSTEVLKSTIQEKKVLIVFDDVIVDMISSKKNSFSSHWAIYWK